MNRLVSILITLLMFNYTHCSNNVNVPTSHTADSITIVSKVSGDRFCGPFLDSHDKLLAQQNSNHILKSAILTKSFDLNHIHYPGSSEFVRKIETINTHRPNIVNENYLTDFYKSLIFDTETSAARISANSAPDPTVYASRLGQSTTGRDLLSTHTSISNRQRGVFISYPNSCETQIDVYLPHYCCPITTNTSLGPFILVITSFDDFFQNVNNQLKIGNLISEKTQDIIDSLHIWSYKNSRIFTSCLSCPIQIETTK